MLWWRGECCGHRAGVRAAPAREVQRCARKGRRFAAAVLCAFGGAAGGCGVRWRRDVLWLPGLAAHGAPADPTHHSTHAAGRGVAVRCYRAVDKRRSRSSAPILWPPFRPKDVSNGLPDSW